MDINISNKNEEEKQQPVRNPLNLEQYARKDNENIFDYIDRVGQENIDVYNENVDRYTIRLREDEYSDLNEIINIQSDLQGKSDESYKIATAKKYAKLYDISEDEAYRNLDNFNYQLFGDKLESTTKKDIFHTVVDMLTLGQNTVDIGMIGGQLREAIDRGDTKRVEELTALYKKYQDQNAFLQSNLPDNLSMKIVEAGAQSLPFTVGAIASSVISPAIGFTYSSGVMAGQEYIDMIENGNSHETAKSASTIAGVLEGIVEVELGNVAGALGARFGGSKAGELLRKNVINKITTKVAEKMHYSGGWRIIANIITRAGAENLEEGCEEAVQETISLISKHIANEVDGLEIEGMSAKEIANDLAENFMGGLYGSLLLSSGSFVMNSVAAKTDYDAIKKAATIIPSEESFKKAVEDNPAFSEMTEETKEKTIHEVYQNFNKARSAEMNASAEELAEVYSADDKSEVMYDEEGNEIETDEEITPEARTDEGNLYKEESELKENKDGTYSGEVVYGDPTNEKAENYGHVSYTIDDETNTVTIDEFKTSYKRAVLRNEIYADFAKQFSGYDIVWNTKGKLAANIKEEITGLNPRGKDLGLNYYPIEGDANQATRVKIARELRSNLNKAKVSDEMISPLVAEFEALGNTFGMNVSDFYNNTFNGKIFGNVEVAKAEALSQGKGAIRGGISIDDSKRTLDGLRAVIYAAENADFSTFSHELAHLGRRMAEIQNGALAAEINEAFGIDENGWTREKEELFAEAFEDYLHTGKAVNDKLKDLFKKLAEFLVRTYHQLHDKITMTDDMEKVYNKLLSGDDSVLRMAEEAVKSGLSEIENNTAENVASQETTETTENITDNDEALSDEEIKTLVSDFTNEELKTLTDAGLITEETAQAVQETKLDDVTQAAVASILDDPTIPQEKKVEAVMKANGESYRIKQENIERYQARTDLNAEEKKAAIDDILNNRTTDRNGGGQALSTLESGKDMLFQIIGKKGAQALDEVNEETYRMDNQRIAEEMEKAGKDARAIRMATGWERGADGEWKYEISDIKIKSNPVFETDEGDYKLAKLSDVIEAEELFDAYPQLKDTVLQIQKLPLGLQGNYTEQDEMFPNGIITISNSNLRRENPEFTRLYENFKNTNPDWKEYERKEAEYDNDEISASDFLEWEKNTWRNTEGYKYYNDLLMGRIVPRMIDGLTGESTIAHEIQHAIQHFEGFATGGSPESLTAKAYNSLIDDLAPIYAEIGSDETLQSKINAYKKANLELDFSRDDILDQIREAESIKDNDPKLTELWNKLQDISKKYNFVYKPEIDPLFDFRITDIDSSNAREALWRAKKLLSERSKEDYRNLAGEVESRNVQARLGMTAEERREQLLEDSEDVTRDEQIIIRDSVIAHAENLEAEEQEKAVREKYQNTEQWMKAPNGKPTNLSEKQWLQVRTPNFKRWFGNWDLGNKSFNIVSLGKAAFNNKVDGIKWAEENGIIGLMSNEETGGKGEIDISKRSIDEMLNESQRKKSPSNEIHYAALKHLKEIIKESEIVDQHPDFVKGKDGKRSPLNGINKDVNIDVLYGAINFEGNNYRVKTTVKRYINRNAKAYAYSVEKIEVLPGTLASEEISSPKGNTSITGFNLLQDVYKVNPENGGNGPLALNDYSKILDENGEPLVIYHGSARWFNEFNDGKEIQHSKAPKGTIFATDNFNAAVSYVGYYGDTDPNSSRKVILDPDSPKHEKLSWGTYRRGGIYELFANIRNPYEVDYEGNLFKTEDGFYDVNEEVKWVLENGNGKYDGLIIRNIKDYGLIDNKDIENAPAFTDIVGFNSNQFKSADQNKGTFDKNNPSILFQTAYHGTSADFDQFDLNYGLSGEGSMSFGYGVYVSGSEDIARDYADRQANGGRPVAVYEAQKTYAERKLEETKQELQDFPTLDKWLEENQNSINNLTNRIEERKSNGLDTKILDGMLKVKISRNSEQGYNEEKTRIEKKIAGYQKDIDDAVAEIEKAKGNGEKKRHLYTVDIPDTGFIKWDKNVRQATVDKIHDALFNKLAYEPNEDGNFEYKGVENELRRELNDVFNSEYTGQSLYGTVSSYLGGDKNASDFLSKIGYKGIDYPAGTNFGNGNGARNYVIFREKDARIISNMLFQNTIDQSILNEAAQFENWMDYRDFMEATNMGTEGVPVDATADWYLNTWEIAHNVSPTTAERNAAEMQNRQDEREEARRDPVMVDSEWYTMIQKPGNLENFLKLVYQATHIDEQEMASLNPDEAAYVSDIVNRSNRMFNHGVYRGNIIRVNNGKELTNKARETILTLMGQRKRDYRAIYADITGQAEYSVDKSELQNENANIAKDALRYKLITYTSDVDSMSPEEKTKLINQINDASIREKFKKDNVKMLDPDVEHYIDMLETELKARNKDIAEMRTEFNEDIERFASKQERDIIKQYESYLNNKSEAQFKKIPLPAGSKNAEKVGESFKRQVQSGMKQSFAGMVQNWDAFKTEVEANVKAQERLRAENKLADLEEKIKAEYDAKRVKTLMSKAERLNAMAKEYTQKQQEVAAARKLREMRKSLVKRVMRRVNFNSVDYNRAKEIIAIQKVFEPNLRGGINKWIGTENRLAREVWSAWHTDYEAKESMLKRLSNLGKHDVIALLEKTQTEEAFNDLSKKDQKKIEKAMPRQDWIRDLKLDVWKEERDNALQLPIKEVTKKEWQVQPDGTRKQVDVVRTEFPSEIEELLVNTLGQDMTYAIQYRHFEDWTTSDMEELAKRLDKMFKEGRDLLAARKEAEKNEADRIRNLIREAIRTTGIVINDDDPDEIKEKKQEKINKILGINQQLPGSAGSKNEKQQTWMDRLLHSYHDANIRRVARILDNYAEGVMTNLLYWQENDCFNREERSKARRNAKIDAVIEKYNLDMRKLGSVFEFNNTKYSYDDILMVWASKLNQDDYFKEQLEEDEALAEMFKENPAKAEAYALEESAYKAIKYGNMILDTEREEFRSIDEKILAEQKERMDKLHAAELAGDEKAIKDLINVRSDIVDENGQIILRGTNALKALADQRIKGLLAATADIYKEFKPLVDVIREDYSAEFDKINEVSIKEFNAPVWREKWYLPLIRLTAAGDTHEQRLKQDLLSHSAGTGKAGTEKGFTKKRVEIGPMNQTPVELGLYSTWADSVERNEHFIAYASYIRELNRILFSKDGVGTMQEIENRYGKSMKDYLDVYVKEVANPNIEEPKKGLDRVMHIMRGNTAPAYLGWKFSSILKQGIESPAPFMQFINPAEYMHGAVQLATKKWTRESIAEKSAFMRSRVFDPIADLINENVQKSFSKKSYYLKKFQQVGMEGLEWIDWACVAPGWIAIYEKEYSKLQAQEQARYDARVQELTEQNETRYGQYRMTEQQIKQQAHDDVTKNIEMEAVNKADDCVRLCQPSNRKVDLSPMFKNNSEAAKAVLQFQTALNVIWQNIRYDIPYAVKNKQYRNIVGMVLGYVMAGVMSGVVTQGLLKDDDDDPEEIAKRLGYYAGTQFIDSIPIVGGNLDGLAEKAITGDGSGIYNSSLWPTFDKYFNAASSFVSGDYDKALRNMEQGLILTLGAPLSGIKEIEAALGINDGESGLEFNPEAFLGRRN